MCNGRHSVTVKSAMKWSGPLVLIKIEDGVENQQIAPQIPSEPYVNTNNHNKQAPGKNVYQQTMLSSTVNRWITVNMKQNIIL